MGKITEFFENVQESIKQVELRTSFIERFYKIANHVVCFRFAGEALISVITPAFEHLCLQESVKAEFTIYIIDSESTGITLNVPLWFVKNHIQAHNPSVPEDGIYSIFNHHTQVINLINLQKNIAIYWPESKAALPWWIIGSPLQRIINVWMKQRGKQLTHAGAVGYEEGGVLLAGKGGSGKSTTVLACIENGFRYVSEDYCLIDNAIVPHAHTVYNSAKITAATLNMFPYLKDRSVNPNRQQDEKAFFFQHEIFPGKALESFPIRAVLLPEVTANNKTELKPASLIKGLFALAPSTFFQLENCDQDTLEHFKNLLMKVPCFHLLLGKDLTNVVSVIKDYLK